MPHMMDDFPLLMSTLYDHAVRQFPDQEIVSVESDRSRVRATYGQTDDRVRRLASAFKQTLGVDRGDAIGTFAWNNLRHHEIYWATANTGTVCHTLNIRLFADQLVYVINHARDKVLFVDPDLAPLLAPLVDKLETVERYVVMSSSAEDSPFPDAIAYDDLIAGVVRSTWSLADARRAISDDVVLHVRHHRPSEGRCLYAALHLHPHNQRSCQLRDPSQRQPVAGRAHVSCCGLGVPLRSNDRGRQTHLPGTRSFVSRPGRPVQR